MVTFIAPDFDPRLLLYLIVVRSRCTSGRYAIVGPFVSHRFSIIITIITIFIIIQLTRTHKGEEGRREIILVDEWYPLGSVSILRLVVLFALASDQAPKSMLATAAIARHTTDKRPYGLRQLERPFLIGRSCSPANHVTVEAWTKDPKIFCVLASTYKKK